MQITTEMKAQVDQVYAEVMAAFGSIQGYGGHRFPMVAKCQICLALGRTTNGGYTPHLSLMVEPDGNGGYSADARCAMHGKQPMPTDERLMQDHPELSPMVTVRGLKRS